MTDKIILVTGTLSKNPAPTTPPKWWGGGARTAPAFPRRQTKYQLEMATGSAEMSPQHRSR